MRSMRLFVVLGLIVVAAAGLSAQRASVSPVSDAAAREAAGKAIALLQQSMTTWDSKRACVSCHHVHLPVSVLRAARGRGVPFDETAARASIRRIQSQATNLDFAVQAVMQIDPTMDTGSILNSLSDIGIAPTLSTQVFARRIARRQFPDGHWTTIDVRPPQAYGTFTATAVAVRAVQNHLPPTLEAVRDAATARARRWLERATPLDTEDRVFQLLGLSWTGAPAAAIERRVKELVATQRPDGGWAQLPRLSSDAYATGQALVVLQCVGELRPDNPVVRRGLAFLLSSQQADGSWHVSTRLHEPDLVSPPYLETGFPHGRDQFVSAMGTAWATMALLESLPVKTPDATMFPTTRLETRDEPPWMRAALFGTTGELRALLDQGLDPSSRTPDGTTMLMMAAHDPDKVQLLLTRGADVAAISKARHTAVMMAANDAASPKAMRLLLDAGGSAAPAPPAPGSTKVFAPILYALWSGESEKVELLLSRGAPLPKRVLLLGGELSVTPLELAVFQRDVSIVRLLADRGVSLDELGESGISALTQAILTNDVELVRTLIELGAPVNQADQHGETPLMHAAMIDYGDTKVIEALLQAGAERQTKSPEGLTAAALAKKFGHTALASRLE